MIKFILVRAGKFAILIYKMKPVMKGGIDMAKIIDMQYAGCSHGCDIIFRECLSSGEDESVCRMKRVPCDCSCSDDELIFSSYIQNKSG